MVTVFQDDVGAEVPIVGFVLLLGYIGFIKNSLLVFTLNTLQESCVTLFSYSSLYHPEDRIASLLMCGLFVQKEVRRAKYTA